MCTMTMTGSWAWLAPLGFLLTIGLWGAIAWGAYRLIGNGAWRGRPTPPEDELAQRFARGDIDVGDYHQRLDALRATAGESNHRV